MASGAAIMDDVPMDDESRGESQGCVMHLVFQNAGALEPVLDVDVESLILPLNGDDAAVLIFSLFKKKKKG